MIKRIAILGATGSIGTQTLEVVRAFPNRLKIIGLTAHRQWRKVFQAAENFAAQLVVISDPEIARAESSDAIQPECCPCELAFGEAGVEKLVTHPEVDIVVASMVGAAGLLGTIKALEAGKHIALANKETLVVAGSLVTELAKNNGCQLLPVDSEHSAVYQCLQAGKPKEVARIILTASGGPFRNRPLETFHSITVAEALHHPNWQMGPKITIDSATMMNKALEIIEAKYLFEVAASQLAVVIHPQSQVHSMVEFVDGSIIGQMSPPDMRLPIQYALLHPERISGPARRADWSVPSRWDFAAPDLERFPALELGFEVAQVGGTSGAAVNAANEVAVARFLAGTIRFTEIVPLVKAVLKHHQFDAQPTLEELFAVDRWSRQEAHSWISSAI